MKITVKRSKILPCILNYYLIYNKGILSCNATFVVSACNEISTWNEYYQGKEVKAVHEIFHWLKTQIKLLSNAKQILTGTKQQKGKFFLGR